MDNFSNNSIQAQYRAELGHGLSDAFDKCVEFIMFADFAKVPQSIIDRVSDYAHDFDHGLTLQEQQYIIEQSSVEGIFNLDLFNSKFPVGPYVEVYPAEYATKAEYKYILINPLMSNHD